MSLGENVDEIQPEATNFTIRRASQDDLDALVQLRLALLHEAGNLKSDTSTTVLAEAIRRYLTENLPTGQFMAWIAQVNGTIIGISGLVFFQRPPIDGNLSGLEAYIMNIYTVSNWRGKGVAMALLQEIISYVKQTEARRIWLHATEDGKRLYEKVGFVSTKNEMELVWS